MSFLNFQHEALAQLIVPPALRGALGLRLRRAAPDWVPWGPSQPAPPVFLTMMLGYVPNCPLDRVTGWASLGEWEPGGLYALRFDYGADGEAAVVSFFGDLNGQPRVVPLAEVAVLADGRLAP